VNVLDAHSRELMQSLVSCNTPGVKHH
jgi:hypothetical protein